MDHKCIDCIHCNTEEQYCYHTCHFTQDESVNPPGNRAFGWGRTCSFFMQKAAELHKCYFCAKPIPDKRLICEDCLRKQLDNARGWTKLDKLKQTPVKEEVEETSTNHRRLECL